MQKKSKKAQFVIIEVININITIANITSLPSIRTTIEKLNPVFWQRIMPFELTNLLIRFFQIMDILKLSTCEPCTFEPVGSVTNVFFDDRCQQVSY